LNGHLRAPHTRTRKPGPTKVPKPRVKAFEFTARQMEIAWAVRDKQLSEQVTTMKESN